MPPLVREGVFLCLISSLETPCFEKLGSSAARALASSCRKTMTLFLGHLHWLCPPFRSIASLIHATSAMAVVLGKTWRYPSRPTGCDSLAA